MKPVLQFNLIDISSLPSVMTVLYIELQTVLDKLHLPISKKAKLSILEDVSGIVKPGRYYNRFANQFESCHKPRFFAGDFLPLYTMLKI